MKVALVHRRLGPQGGVERFVLGFARHLATRGHEVHAWCARFDARPAGVQLHALRESGPGAMIRALSLYRSSKEAGRDGCAVVGFGRTAPPFAVWRAGGGCHRAWVDRRGWQVGDPVEVALDRAAARGARIAVVNSAMVRDELVRWYGLDPARIRLVRNGVDLSRFRPISGAEPPVPRPAACFVGSGFLRKGLDTAIRALALVPDVHLAVYGRDANPGRWTRLARRMGVAERVRLMGPSDSLETVLPSFQALLLPTRYDPSANATLEAMAAGVPPVTTRHDGASEVLPVPWLAVPDPEDPIAVARTLQRVLGDPELPAACRAAAERYPQEATFEAMEELVRDASA